MLALLLIRRVLKDLAGKPRKDDYFTTRVLVTPLGKFGSIRESQLELLQMPYVTEAGEVGRIPMKELYLDHVLSELAAKLNVKDLFDGSREFIIVADVDVKKGGECCPCYYSTTRNTDDMESLQYLESTVNYCLDHNLDALPSNILHDWKEMVLRHIFEHAKSVIKDEGV